MSIPASADLQTLEETYKQISLRRLELEAEFFRIENEYRNILKQISTLKDETSKQSLHKKIIDL